MSDDLPDPSARGGAIRCPITPCHTDTPALEAVAQLLVLVQPARVLPAGTGQVGKEGRHAHAEPASTPAQL